jgi:hypothetical protein
VGWAVLQETVGKQEPWVSSSPLPPFCFAGCGPSSINNKKNIKLVFGSDSGGQKKEETEIIKELKENLVASLGHKGFNTESVKDIETACNASGENTIVWGFNIIKPAKEDVYYRAYYIHKYRPICKNIDSKGFRTWDTTFATKGDAITWHKDASNSSIIESCLSRYGDSEADTDTCLHRPPN